MSAIAFDTCTWLNEPPAWSIDGGTLHVETGLKTDFWQATNYGFHRDDGHALMTSVSGDFTASITFEGNYETLFDQAGMMIRLDPLHWIKLGIEHAEGADEFSVVVTRERSDWSMVRVAPLVGPQTIRITRRQGTVVAHFRTTDGSWRLMRVADFPAVDDLLVGAMACSPGRAGFQASFTDLRIEPPLSEPLHG